MLSKMPVQCLDIKSFPYRNFISTVFALFGIAISYIQFLLVFKYLQHVIKNVDVL